MSGRNSKKNQRLGSSRRGPKGLNRNAEKDDDDDDRFQQTAESEVGRDEFHAISATQFDHPPSSSIEQQTSALECPPHARGHKDSPMKTELPERKRKMGSTRKSTGTFKGERKLHDVRTTEELDEEYVTQTSTSTTEEQHASLTEEEQSSFPSDLSLQTKSSGFGKESVTTLMFAVSENKEKDTIHHQEITSHSHEVVSDVPIDEAMGPSVHSIAVTVAENVGVQEHSRNMTENESKEEVMGEAKLKMSEEMAQTWDDVARDDPSSHTKSALLLSQSLLADRAELKVPDVSAGTETMNQSVAFPLVDSEKPLPETFSHHRTPLLNEELDFKFGSHTEDFDVLNKVLKEAGSHLSDKDQHMSDTRKEAKKVVLKQKEEPQLEELALQDQESSLSQHDIATPDNNSDCSMVQHIVGGSRSFDMPVSNISHAEPTTTNLPHEMRDAVEERQEIRIEMKQENNVCNVASVTRDTLTDLLSITEEDEDTHSLATRENENMRDERGSETEYAFEMTDQGEVRDHNVTQIIMDVRDNEKDVETSTETIWISHQKPCDISTENKEQGQEYYSSNISLTHSPPQDDAGKMLENEEVRKDKKQTENTAVNDVTSKSEEMISFEDSATDRGSHAHKQLFMQSPDKGGYDLHGNDEKSEKEEILFSVESENAAFDRGNERSEATYGIKEMDAAPVLTLDVGEADLHLEIEAQNKTFDSTNSEADGTEENVNSASVSVRENKVIGNTVEHNMTAESDFLQSSPDAHKEALNVSENAEKEVSGETILKQSDINIVPEVFHGEEAHAKSSPIVHKRKMGSARRPLKGKKGQRKEIKHHDENETLDSEDMINVEKETFRLESEPSPDESTLQSLKDGAEEKQMEICEKNDVGLVEGSESALLQSSCSSDLVSEESTAISICHITESQTLTKIDEESQENTGDAERVTAEGNKDLQLETDSQNKTFDLATSEAEGTEENIQDVSVTLIREVEVIGDTDTVETNMTTESDFLQTSPDAHIEALKVSKNAEKEVSGETDTIPEQSDISIIPADSHREETHSKSSPVIHKRKMGSTRRPLKGNTGQRKDDEKEIFNLDNEPSPDESRYTEVSIGDISESQTLTKIDEESQENTGDAERVAAEGNKGLQLETDSQNKTFDLATSEAEGTEENIQDVSVTLIREVEVIGDTDTVETNMTTESDFLQTPPDAHMEALKVSKNAEKKVSGETDTIPEQSDISIIPADSHREETHSKSSPVIHKRKMGSTRRPLKGNKGRRKDHNEKEIFSLDDEPSPDESRYELSISDISESQTITKIHARSHENIGDIAPAEGDTESHSENKVFDSTAFEGEVEVREVEVIGDTVGSNMTTESDFHKTSDANKETLKVSENSDSEYLSDALTNSQSEIQPQNKMTDLTSEAERTEDTICEASVSVREEEFTVDTVIADSNMTIESDLLQNDTLNDAKNTESVSSVTDSVLLVQDDVTEGSRQTDTFPEQSDISIIPGDSHGEEAHSISSPIVHKRKMGSTRRPVRGNKGQSKQLEHHEENETLDSDSVINAEKETISLEDEPSPDESTLLSLKDVAKEQEMEICEKNDVGLVEGSESALLQSPCSSDLVSEESTAISICHITESQTLTKIDEVSQENTGDAERVAAEEDKGLQLETDSQNKTFDLATSEAEGTEDNIQDVSVTLIREAEVIGDTDTVETNMTTESDFLQMSPDAHMEALKVSKNAEKEVSGETDTIPEQSDISMIPADSHREETHSKSSPVIHKRKMGSTRRPLKGNTGQRKDHHEKEIFSLDDEPSPDESRYELSIGDISESQTITKIHAGSHENTGDVERAPAEGDTESHSENKVFDSTAFEGEVEVREVEVIGDTVGSNMTTESDFHKTSDANKETLKVSENSDSEYLSDALTNSQSEIQPQNKMTDLTSEAERTEDTICEASVSVREDEFTVDTVIADSNMTIESDLLQNYTLNDAKNTESVSSVTDSVLLVQDDVTEGSRQTDTFPEQSDISIIPADSHREETHSKSSPVIHKRKMGSTRRPLKGNTGQRKDDEKEIFNLDNEPSPDESRYTEVSIGDISESQTITKIHAGSQENTGDVERVPAEGDTESHSENKTFDSVFEGEATEENMCKASVLVREVEFIGDAIIVESNMTTESDLIQNNTSSEAKLEAIKVSDNPVHDVLEETDEILKQSDTKIIPEDTQKEEAHSKFTVTHKRKMGSTRRPLRGNKGQRKEIEHHGAIETLDSDSVINAEKETISLEDEPSPDESTLQSTKDGVKEQEMEICEKNDVGLVEGSESALLQSSCSSDLVSEESTAISICHITESQTLTKIDEESQENTGDAERVAAEEDKDLKLEIDSQNKTFDLATSEAEGTEDNIQDVSVTLIREVEVIGDTDTVDTNMTTESDFLQTSPDAHMEALKVSKDAEKEVSGETDTIPEQSDISIISADSHREETHSKSSPVIHKRKMGSTRRPLKGNKGRRKDDEKEIFNLDNEPSPDESRYTEVSIGDISESQTITKIHAGYQENTGDVERVPAEGDTESHSENKTFDSVFEGEATEENMCKTSVLVREVEFIGDAIIVESNMTTESDLIQNNTSSEAKLEAIKVSDNPVHVVLEETDEIPKQSDTKIIPEDTQKEEAHSKFTVTHKRKMGSTRRPLRGNKGQRKEIEHHGAIETLDSDSVINAEKETISLEDEPSPDESTLQSTKDGVKEQEMEICEKNDVGPVEGSESALLQSSCSSDLVSEESTAISICHITESQTLTKIDEESQENTGDAERVAAEGNKGLQLETDSQNKTFDLATSEAEGTEENIQDFSVTLIREVEVIGDTDTVETNMTTESDFLQTPPDAHMEALKVSKNAEKKVSGETDTIPEQSDISIIPADSHREETHSKSSPVIHKRKMGSTRRPLKGNKGRRKDHNEKEIFSLDDEPSPDESRYELSIGDISESQTITKIHARSHENIGDVDIAPAEGDTESHSENKVFDSTAFEGEVEVREVEVIGDTVGSNMTTESDFHKTSDANKETLKVSENSDSEYLSDALTNSQSEIQPQNKMTDLTSEAERTEDTICEASVSVREEEFTVDTVIADSNMTIESDLLQNDTLNDAKNTESVSSVTDSVLLVQDDVTEGSRQTDTFPEQSDISIIPGDSHGEEAHSISSPIVHKRKMGSTRRPVRGNKGQSKQLEHHEENETLDSDSVINAEKETISLEDEPSPDESTLLSLKDVAKEQEMEICEKNDVGLVEGSESALLQSPCSSDLVSEESTAISICHITESQTLTKIDEVSQENTGDAERVAAEEDKGLQLETDSQNKTFDLATSEAEGTEDNIQDVSVTLIREAEVIGDTDTVETYMTTESDFLQMSPDAHMEALKVSKNAEKEVSGETDTIPEQSDISIIPADSHREETHSKSSPVIHKRKMGSTRRPLKGNTGQRKDHHEKEIFSLDDEPSPDESRYELSIGDISESQTITKIHAGSHENIGDVDIAPAEGDTESHSENKVFDSTAFEGEVEVREVEVIGDTVGSNMTTESDFHKTSDANKETLKVSENSDSEYLSDALTNSQSEIQPQNKMTDLTSEAERTEDIICEASVSVREDEFTVDTVIADSNMTIESDLLQNYTLNDAKNTESVSSVTDSVLLVQDDVTEGSRQTDTFPEQSDISIIPADSHREETHSKSSPVIHKRKMGSTRRPLKGNTGQRKDDEKEIFNLDNEPSPDESRYTEVSIGDISESQTITKIHAGSQENTGDVERVPAEGDTESHSENKTFDSVFEGEATEENICKASVLVREVEFIGDAIIVESNMTTESDLIQNNTSSEAKLEAIKVSDNPVHDVLEETDEIPKQSDTTIIPEDTQKEEAHSKFTVTHKRKMGSTRRPLRGNKGQRKEIEHHGAIETLDSDSVINAEKETISLEDEPSSDESTLLSLKDVAKEQEMEICEKNDVGPVEGSESALLQSPCSSDLVSEESTAISICHITESQTLTKIDEVSQENTGDAERMAAEEDKDLQLETDSQNKTFDLATSEAEGTEENIQDVSVTLIREVEVIGDTDTVETNMTTESDFLQTSPDAHMEALKVSKNAEKEVSGETDTIPEQSDISIISADSHREETHSKSSPVIHKRKMGSTRRPLKGNKGRRKDDEKEIFNLDNEPSPDESRYTEVSIGDISESQTLTKIHAGYQENTGDVERVPAEGDTESHSENKTFDSTAFEGEVEVIGDTVGSNMTTESDFHKTSDANKETLKVSENSDSEYLSDALTNSQSEIQPQNKMTDLTSEAERTEDIICEASVSVREDEFTVDTVIADSNMTIESDLLQNDTLNDAKNTESVSSVTDSVLLVQDDVTEGSRQTDTFPEQSDISIIPGDSHGEEAHSISSPIVHKRKMGSTRRPVRGNKGQSKQLEHHEENETLDSDSVINAEKETISLEDEPSPDESTLLSLKDVAKEQEMEICEKNDVGLVEGSESALLQSPCSSDLVSEESTAISICHITESQTLTKIDEESQENTGDAERVAAEEDKGLQLETDSQNKTFDLATSEAEGTEDNIQDVSVTLIREAEVIGDTDTVETNMTTESDFLQMSPDAHMEALKVSKNAEKEVSGETDTIPEQSDISIIPADSHREETHSKSSPVIHKRKMGSTRRPLKGNKGQRKDDEKEIFNLDNEPSPDESRYTEVSIGDISESQTLTKIHAGYQENTGDVERVPAEGDTESHSENKTFDSVFEGEATEENICKASVLVREVEFIEDAIIIESNMTTESDLIQNNTSSEAKLEAIKVSDNPVHDVLEETDEIPKQSDTTIIPEDTQKEEAHSKFTVTHKRKMGSTRRPLRGNKGQRKEIEHHGAIETLDSDSVINAEKETISLEDEPSPDESTLQSTKDGVKEQEMEICEKNDVGPVEGSESALLQSSCSSDLVSEESTPISICHITESQTLTKIDEVSQENTGDAERMAAEEDKDLQLEIDSQNKTFDLATSEAEGTEENIQDVSVTLIREVEVIGDTDTVETNMTTESDFLQMSPDAHMEALKVSKDAEKEVSGETDTIPEQSDISIISADSHREETHSKSSPVIHKRKMGSTRRPLKGNKGRRKDDEKEIFNLDNEPSPDESRYTEVSIGDISESQTLTKIHAGYQENTGDVERVPAEGDTESHSENKTFDSVFEGEATEENMCKTSVLVREVEFIGDAIIMESNMTTESDLIQNNTSSEAKLEAIKVSDNPVHDVLEETDEIPKQSDTKIIPEDTQKEEAHSKFTVTHKRKMGSTRRPLRGNKGQRKEIEHHGAIETLDSDSVINAEKETISLEDEPSPDESTLQSTKDGVKEQEMEICEKNDVGLVEGSESALLQSSCSSDLVSEESTAISICHITESQTLTKIDEGSQENTGDAERVAAEEDKDLQLEIDSQNKTFDLATSEAEGTEENIQDVSVTLIREVEVIGDTDTVESHMTTESDFLQTSPDAHMEALKVSKNAEKEVSGETDTIPEQSDISIIPADSHREETHSKSSPVIHKRKMGSTRRPLKGNKGLRKGHDEKEIFNLDNEPSPDESRYTEVSICDISESQTITKIHAGYQENTGDVERAPAEGDTESHSENKVFDSTAFEGEVEVREVEVIGDTVGSNMTTESDFHQTSDANKETLKVSENSDSEYLSDALTNSQSEIQPQNKMTDLTSEAERTEDTICEASVSVREEEFTVDTVIADSNMTIESDLLQNDTLNDAKNTESVSSVMDSVLLVQDDVTEGSRQTDTIPEQSDISIISADSHREETHSKSSPVIHKRKMGSTRRPLKGNTGQRKDDEKEIFNLDNEPSPDESRYTEVSIGDISESQTLTKIDEESQENTGDAERVAAEEDKDLKLEIDSQNKTFDLATSEAEGTEDNIQDVSVTLIREVEVIGDTDTVETNMTTESDFLQTSPDAHMEALKVSKDAEKEVSGETDTIPEQSDISIIPADSHREETHSKSSPVIHKRKMGSTRRPLKGNKGRRKDDEKEIFNLDNEPSPDESRYTEVSIGDISESQTLTKIHAGYQENTGDVERVPAEGDTESHSENKTFDSVFEGEATEENMCKTSVLVREVEFIGDAIIVESNMTTESDLIQNNTSSEAKLEAIKVSDNPVHDVLEETDEIPKQSDTKIIPEDTQKEEAHSKFTVTHKRKMGSTRRPLRGNKGQRKEIEHHGAIETLDSDSVINAEKETISLEDEPSPDESTLQSTKDGVKEQEMEICEKNDVGLVEGSESALLQSSCSSDLVSEESTAISICHITESQTLTKIDEGSQENTGDAERVAAEEDKDLQLEIDSQNKTFDLATSEAEGTEENIQDVSVMLIREVEVIGDTDTVESHMTTESDFLQTSPDAHMEALKVSKNAEKEVSGETDTIPEQSDISIIPADSHREETHSKSSPVIHKRKMGSTRRPLKGNKGLRKGHDEKEIFNLDNEPSPDESRYTEVSIGDISESQTITKIHAGSQENTGDVERAPEEADTESHSENKTIYSPTFEGESTEENFCAASALDRQFIGDAVIVESNMTPESDFIQNYTSTDAKPEALISEIAENEISGKTDTISKQSVPNIIPENLHGDEVHSKLSLNVHKRKMGSTRRPLRGNKEQRKERVESKENNEDSEGVSEEEDTETHSEIQNRDKVVDHNVTQEIINIRDVEDEERKTTKTVDMPVQELCDDLEQRSDASQTQTGPSQDYTASHLLEFQERTADFVRYSNNLSDVVVSDALFMEETQIHVSSNDVPPTEVVEMNPVSKKSKQKRKMGSTRKRGKRMVNDEEVEEKEGETENTTIDDETTKSEEKLTLEEAITGSLIHQQLFSSSADKEGHDIQDIVCKSDLQAENSEQNDPNSTINHELSIEFECSSNIAAEMVSDLLLGDVDTYLHPKQSVIPKESHREDQPNLNPVVQKRKMGSTRKTLRGNKGQGRIAEFKKMDGDSEGMTQEQDTERHLETSARKTEFDEEVEQNFPVEFSHPVAPTNMFPEPENGVKELSQNIHDLSEVSEEKGMDNTGNDSNSLSEAIHLHKETNDSFFLTVSHENAHQIVSEPEQTENTQELRATQDDVHENNSQKIPATQEKRRKMGSTRRNPQAMHGKNMSDNEDVLGVAEDRESTKAADDLEEALSISQSKEVSSVSTTGLESEMIISATHLKVENDHLHSSRPTVPETPENTLQICDNQLVNADVTKHPQSETLTTEKRRKMGSTRKNLREGKMQRKRDGYEVIETEDTNLQMSQDSEMSLVRENVGQQITHSYSNQSEDSLLSEIERALNKTSQSSSSCDSELIIKEPNPDDLSNAPDLNMPENSEIKSLQPMPSAHSEPNSPEGRRRKMGSTRKNPRQQLKAEREAEDKENGEIDENSKANKQEKKNLERVEVSVVHNISENRLNKEYLDVSSAHTSSNQLEESTNPVSQETTSPSTKRKFGSRRANKGKQGLGRLADSDFGNDLEDGDHSSEVKDKLHSHDLAVCDPCLTLQPENQPAAEQRNMEAKNEEAAPKGTGAGLVSLDHIIKHDTTGAKQTVNLKNRNTEVVQFNVVMVGNSCVGKTSFIRRFHEGQFTEDYCSTIGVDTCVQTVALPDRTVKLQIWDTAGQERFHSITTQVFHRADGILLMYEIACSKSFISVRDWISQARERAPDDVIMMLLGNKNDAVKREVQIQEGVDLAGEYNIHFMECSAATGANVSESMRSLAELLVQRKSQKEKHTTLRREPAQKKSGCC